MSGTMCIDVLRSLVLPYDHREALHREARAIRTLDQDMLARAWLYPAHNRRSESRSRNDSFRMQLTLAPPSWSARYRPMLTLAWSGFSVSDVADC
jgi:hypothetical protein